MSSFINSPGHFNSVERFLINANLSSNDKIYALRLLCKDKGFPDDQQIMEFMTTLRELQALCVCLQYKHHSEGKLDKEIQEQTAITKLKTSITKLNTISGFKALLCIRYQIETCHLKELRALTDGEALAMDILTKVIAELADTIARSLPAYDKAPWSI